MITIITPTGDRPILFRLCEQWMSRQTRAYYQWIVVDDGKIPTHTTLGQDYVRREPSKDDPPHTLGANLRVALPLIKNDHVIIIEDDDYYHPMHLEQTDDLLDLYDLVGVNNIDYYNITTYSWRKLQSPQHSSLCQTGFTKDIIPHIASCLNSHEIDRTIWSTFKGNKHLADTSRVVGMKGLPGRHGQRYGHTLDLYNDKDLSMLSRLLGRDLDVYKTFFKIEPLSIELPSCFAKIRRDTLGNYYLPRPDKKLVPLLNKFCTKIEGEWKWKPYSVSFKLMQLQDKYQGLPCYIIGKGPSLDYLKANIFPPDCVIICLNESIKKVESLQLGEGRIIFALQQDAVLKDTCYSHTGSMLVSYLVTSWYKDHPSCFTYTPDLIGLTGHPASVIMAIHLSKYMGVKDLKMVSFDAYTKKDTSYAKVIGYASDVKKSPHRFLNQRKPIELALKTTGLSVTWMTPAPTR